MQPRGQQCFEPTGLPQQQQHAQVSNRRCKSFVSLFLHSSRVDANSTFFVCCADCSLLNYSPVNSTRPVSVPTGATSLDGQKVSFTADDGEGPVNSLPSTISSRSNPPPANVPSKDGPPDGYYNRPPPLCDPKTTLPNDKSGTIRPDKNATSTATVRPYQPGSYCTWVIPKMEPGSKVSCDITSEISLSADESPCT